MAEADPLIGKKVRCTTDCDPYYRVGHVCIVNRFDGADYWGDFRDQGNSYVNDDGDWCIGKYPAEFELVGHAEAEASAMVDDEDASPEPANGGFCPKCGGSGRDDYSDGLTECDHCNGEGHEWWQ